MLEPMEIICWSPVAGDRHCKQKTIVCCENKCKSYEWTSSWSLLKKIFLDKTFPRRRILLLLQSNINPFTSKTCGLTEVEALTRISQIQTNQASFFVTCKHRMAEVWKCISSVQQIHEQIVAAHTFALQSPAATRKCVVYFWIEIMKHFQQ